MPNLHGNLIKFVIISRSFLRRMRCVSDKRSRENENTYFISNKFFPPENRAVYETMWKNMVELDRPQMAI
jgi:hypothetical protein